MTYETVIGLEVHAQLKTATKIFCADAQGFGEAPNSHTCPVCLGMPGTLPVVNAQAIDFAVRAALAFGCEIRETSIFARKHYFYPDLPKGYQISQYERPLAEHGHLMIDLPDGTQKRIGITRIHLEEDAGKNTHLEGGSASYVDYNRASVPLIEIVSEPDMRSTDEAVAYVKKLRQILVYLGVCDGNMEEGSLRVDANVSLRPVGQAKLGTRSELKNINSFRFMQKGMEFEIARHAAILDGGGTIVQETRLFDHASGETRSLRGKEESHDYRYFPEPDLLPLFVPQEFVDKVRAGLPELPDARVLRYVARFGLPAYDAQVLTAEREWAEYFEATVAAKADPKKASNWIMTELMRVVKESGKPLAESPVAPEHLAALIRLIDAGTISGKIAKSVFLDMLKGLGEPEKIVAQNPDYQLMSDSGELDGIIAQVLAANGELVAKFKAGNERVLGALVGQVMKATKGKADPGLVNSQLLAKLSS